MLSLSLIAKINETSTFGPTDDDITFDYDGYDYDDDDEEDIVDAVSFDTYNTNTYIHTHVLTYFKACVNVHNCVYFLFFFIGLISSKQ